MAGKVWLKEEDEIVKNYFPLRGSKIIDILPHRTVGAIQKRAQFLGIEYGIRVYIDSQGYLVYRPSKNEMYYVHRLVMEHILGRRLEDDELVHHLNGNKLNNTEENLVLTNRSEHINEHREALYEARWGDTVYKDIV